MIFAKRAKIPPKPVLALSFTRLESRVYRILCPTGASIIISFPPEAWQVVCLKPNYGRVVLFQQHEPEKRLKNAA